MGNENQVINRVLAFDFGASSGRAMLGSFVDGQIHIEEIHRFSNDPVMVNGTMYWDTLRLFHEIKQGILKAKGKGGFDSIGIDTWGVDFGLLDEEGNLLENPIHYRDSRTYGMLEESFKRISKDEFYHITGNQFMEINTAFQLLSLRLKRPELLKRVKTMLLTPDLFGYFLTGEKVSEYSIASTTQLLDAKGRTWSNKVMEALDLPREIFPDVVSCPTVIGALSKGICEELDVNPAKIIAVASHDTQSALVSVPAKEKDFVFLSCGTWSLLGTELDQPLVNEQTERLNITNEGGCEGKISFLKNIIGLWLIQESRRQWILEGQEYSFTELEVLGREAKPHACFIDPDAPEFIPSGNVPRRIREYCERTGQYVPQTVGEIVRCINESLALKYRLSFEELKECTGKDYSKLYMVGGGIQSKLLCQMTANSCGVEVSAGPVEATVLGNVALQLMALGEFKDLGQIRETIAKSPDIACYEPKDHEDWENAYKRFKALIK
jgi:rhamnulokinase/L-fuculokinase